MYIKDNFSNFLSINDILITKLIKSKNKYNKFKSKYSDFYIKR